MDVRELENLVERLVVTTVNPTIGPDDLPDYLRKGSGPSGWVPAGGLLPLKEAVTALEKRLIQDVMKQEGSTRRAARRLRVDQSTIVRKMKRYGIEGVD